MAQSSDLTEAYTGSPRPTPNKEDVELKKPDSTWLIPYKGKQWPVVICHYEQTPRAFQEIHPPRDTHVPAILLGRHIFISADKRKLEPYIHSDKHLEGCATHDSDLPAGNETEGVKLEKQRRMAFRTEAREWRTAQQWCDYIESKREQRQILRNLQRKHSSSLSKSPESRDVQLTGSRKRRRDTGPGPYAHAVHGRKLGHPPNGFYNFPSKPDQTRPKSSKRQPISRGSERRLREADHASPIALVRDENDPDFSMGGDRGPAIARAADGMCNIIVGKERTLFLLGLEAVGACAALSDLVVYTEELGSHITIHPDEYAISAKAFMPIFEYLRNGDFHPALSTYHGQTFLQNVQHPGDKEKAAVRIADTYRVASLLQMAPLQDLCLQKLGMLYPLGPKGIVAATGAWLNSEKWGFGQEGEFERVVKDYLKEHFWMLMKSEGKSVSKILRASQELKRELLGMVLGDDEKGMRGFEYEVLCGQGGI